MDSNKDTISIITESQLPCYIARDGNNELRLFITKPSFDVFGNMNRTMDKRKYRSPTGYNTCLKTFNDNDRIGNGLKPGQCREISRLELESIEGYISTGVTSIIRVFKEKGLMKTAGIKSGDYLIGRVGDGR